MRPLPIDEVMGEVMGALRAQGQVILQAPPGAGKSTRVPPGVRRELGGRGGKVYVLEPRRVAAQSVATRIAKEGGWALGGREVGYHVRFDKRVGGQTQVEVMTEGIFLRKLQADPMLEGVGCVIFDEFHERSTQMDLALAMAKEVRQVREDLWLVVMSATLESEALRAYLKAPVVCSQGRAFPVDVVHRPVRGAGVVACAVSVVREAVAQGEGGDILVFASGKKMIAEIVQGLGGLGRPVVSLHGGLKLADQARAIVSDPQQPRVIVATNVAETSLTVEGVTLVVDTGRVKRMEVDPGSGLQRLVERQVALDSATQRAGRAGRVRPGRAVRLWGEHEEQGMPKQTPAQITQADLVPYMLDVVAWSPRPAQFEWFEAPPEHAIDRAMGVLERLGGVEQAGEGGLWRVTLEGEALRQLPLHPRLGAMVRQGARLGLGRAVAQAAAVLSEGDFVDDVGRDGHERCDLWARVQVLGAGDPHGAARGRGWRVNSGQIRAIAQVADQVWGMCRGVEQEGEGGEEAFIRALAAGYSDRVCLGRGREQVRDYVMVGGEPLTLARESLVEAGGQVLLALTIAGGRRVRVDASGVGERGLIRLASSLELGWLKAWFPERWKTQVEVAFDPELERVTGTAVVRFDGLVVEQRKVSVKEHVDQEEVGRMLAQGVGEDLVGWLRLDKDEAQWLERIACARRWMPQLGLPDLEPRGGAGGEGGRGACGQALLEQWCWGSSTVGQMRQKRFEPWLRGVLTRAQWEGLQRDFPGRLELPSGQLARIDYGDPMRPVLAVKLQKLFGWSRVPALAGGAVELTLHLLAPNQRPVQVTQDLASFWENTYPQVRKELRARYVKHKWPEDPWTG